MAKTARNNTGTVERKREFHAESSLRSDRTSPFRWILSHTFRYPHLPALLFLTSVVNNYAYSGIQILTGRIFDVIVTPGWATSSLLALVSLTVGAAVLQGLTGLGRNFAVEFLAQRVERDTREEYYASLLEKSQTFHSRQRVGDLMARATFDVRALNYMYSPGIMLITDSALAYFVPLVMIAFIHPALLVVPLLFTVFLVLTVVDYNRRLEPVSLAQQEQYGKLSAGLEEAVAGIITVKAQTRERYEWEKFTSDARRFRDYFVKQGIIQAKYWPMLVFSVSWGAALFHGLWLWQAGGVSIGEVIAFIGLFSTFRFVTFISLFSFNLVQHGMASAKRILQILTTSTEMDQNRSGVSKRIEGRVEFRNVSFSYENSPVLEGIAFTAEPGTTTAIVGRTGSGKTTLSRLINRIFDPDAGNVLIDGIDVRDWNLESLRSQISGIEQDVFLFSRSIRDNIAFGKSGAPEKDIVAAAKAAQVHDFILSLEKGYDTVVGERGVTLSGGQKQRIAIARAFLSNPRILILDDSTSAIDSRTEDEIQKAMRRVSRDRTTFIITHRLSQIRWADNILVLGRGNMLDLGTHEELLSRSEDYRRIFERL